METGVLCFAMGAREEQQRPADAKLVGEIEISAMDGDTNIIVHAASSMLQPRHVECLRQLEAAADGTRLKLRFALVDHDPGHILESAPTHDDHVNEAIRAMGSAFEAVRLLQEKSPGQIAEALSAAIGIPLGPDDIEAFEARQRAMSMSLFMAWCMVLESDPSAIMGLAMRIAENSSEGGNGE